LIIEKQILKQKISPKKPDDVEEYKVGQDAFNVGGKSLKLENKDF